MKVGRLERGMHTGLYAPIPWLVAILVALPFGQIFHVKLGFITLNLFELILIAISVSLLALILLKGIRAPFAAPLLLFVAMAALYVVGSAALLSVNALSAVRQLRFFLPFFVATLLLATPLRIEFRPFLRVLLIAALLSSAAALLLHHVYPDIVQSSLSASQEVVEVVVQHGRLYWANALIAFLVVASVFIVQAGTAVQWMALLLSSAALLNTASRTLGIGMLLFVCACAFVVSNNSRGRVRIYLATTLIILVAIGSFTALAAFDPRVFDLFALRYLGQGDVEVVYEQAVLVNRLVLYEQYWASLSTYFPLGQGLGIPIASHGTTELFTTDISILSFMLPFGVLGLLTLIAYLRALKRMIEEIDEPSLGCRHVKALTGLLLMFFVLVSLNFDVFSRNIAVVWFTSLVIAAHSTRRQPTR